jgi:hypothetical protein
MKLELPDDHPYKDGRLCTACGEFKTSDNFALERNPAAFKGIAMRSTCRPCTEFRKYKAFLKLRYNITYEDYEKILEDQNYCCAICGEEENGNSRTSGRLFVDHCHSTGKVRGLLCSRCNHGLGHFRDNPNLLNNAIQYLKS